MRRQLSTLRQALLLLATALFLLACGESNAQNVTRLTGKTMGTFWNITIAAELDATAKDSLQQRIDTVLEAVNDSMSTYREHSELMRFNRSRDTEPQAVSDGLRKVLAKALDISRASDGVYDVTVGPLVNLWGFGPEKRQDKPTEAEIAAALQHIGYHKLHLSEEGLSKSDPDIYIDLSSIAKGYGVDVVADTIAAAGYPDYLVEIGGEIRVKGSKYGSPWRIGVERPEAGLVSGGAVANIITMNDRLPAMATSGNYRNYAERGGEMAYHIIDPRDGKSHSSRLLSATVLAEDCMTADGYATALMALGDQQALAFADAHNLAAEFILSGNGTPYIIQRSKAFTQAIQEEKP